MRIKIAEVDPMHTSLTWQERWEGPDGGLISCWQRGREKAGEDPSLAAAAIKGELIVLPWKGGIERATKQSQKYGSLCYLAMWQGLRGDPLDLDTEQEVTLTCSRTGMKVTYTPELAKYSQQI